MKKMLLLFLVMSMMFILATTSSEGPNLALRDNLDKYFTEYIDHYFFTTSSNIENNAADLKRKEISKSILTKPLLKEMGLL